MRLVDVEQGSQAWVQARLGLPTASCFDKILTSGKLQYSASAPKYRNKLLAEWILGYSLDESDSDWMERGRRLEPEARRWYAFDRGVTVSQTGLILRDDGKVGGSPDGLVGEEGGLEIKCPALVTHVGYMLGDGEALAAEYRHQVQGLLYLTGRAWWDIVSYNPELPSVVVRVEPDPAYLAALDAALTRFVTELDAAKAQLAEYRTPFALQAVA